MERFDAIKAVIRSTMERRKSLVKDTNAYRLFNGFYEGFPGLVLDRYGSTLVIFDHAKPGDSQEIHHRLTDWVLGHVDGLETVLLKQRQHPEEQIKNGLLIRGETLSQFIIEFGVKYAVDLQMNQDASFYLDTRNLRYWLRNHMAGRRVLNTFAYTGSLGVAAYVAGAQEVVQTDINGNFLAIAERSWALNNLPAEDCAIIVGDFFRVTGRLRNNSRMFDCVIIDPPFFSTTNAGKVDLQHETTRLINKVRPLVSHEGWLVVINNALFLSGKAFKDELDALCSSPYLAFEGIVPIPQDVTGFPDTVVASPPTDPYPFNHPTKIAILKVFRKDKQQ